MTDKAFQALRSNVPRSSITRPANVTPYAIGDCVSAVTSNAHFAFTNALTPDAKWSGEVVGVKIVSSTLTDIANAEFTLALFTAEIPETADNTAFTLSDTQALTYIGQVSVVTADWLAGSLNMMASVTASLKVRGINPGTIFGQLIADDAYVPASGQIFTIDLTVRQD